MTSGRLQIAMITHQGKVREHNEDCVAVGRTTFNESMLAASVQSLDLDGPIICMIADGVGGQAAGEVASQHACRRMIELTADASPTVDALNKVILTVHSEIYDLMKSDSGHLGMGTTVAGLLLSKEVCLGFNVGDSRVYRIQNGFLAQLSIDDAAKDHRRGVITQCLGGTGSYTKICPHIFEERLPGQSYLVCSDGLTDMLSIDEIEGRLADDPLKTVENLFSEAMYRGATDNISIVFMTCVH
jgi:PPM family protein phosphatase